MQKLRVGTHKIGIPMVVNHAELPANIQQVLSDAIRKIGKLERENERLRAAAREVWESRDIRRDYRPTVDPAALLRLHESTRDGELP